MCNLCYTKLCFWFWSSSRNHAILEEAMSIYHWCHSCNFWVWDENIILDDGSVVHPGHCGLYSAKCINSVVDEPSSRPPHFQKLDYTMEDYEKDLSSIKLESPTDSETMLSTI